METKTTTVISSHATNLVVVVVLVVKSKAPYLGGRRIFISSYSALLTSFEIDCFYGL
jgi:hypothetical protein